MYLLDFMNIHEDWQQLLAAPPYNLFIRQDGDYILLDYNMYSSDFTLPEVLEARGSIFTYRDNQWCCVCRALDKFANFGEPYAATARIDWSKGVDIQEKVDGSIVKVWWDREWHVSSNGCINAANVKFGNYTMDNVFFSVLGESRDSFFSKLNPAYCYWFELVSHFNPIVVQYAEEGIYYLGAREMRSMVEFSSTMKPFIPSNLKFPRHYHFTSLAECIAAAHQLGDDEEGYVVVSSIRENGSFLRVKVKGDEYLRLHRLRGVGPLTIKRVVKMFKENSLDDFLAYFPQYRNFIDVILTDLIQLANQIDAAWGKTKTYEEQCGRKAFALRVREYPPMVANGVFMISNGRANSGWDYLKTCILASGLTNYLESRLSIHEVGVEEDS